MSIFIKCFFSSFRISIRLFLFIFMMCINPFAYGAIVIGNLQGTVTLTEVIDYQCEYCHRMQSLINWLMVHNKNLKIRLIPVAIINKNSLLEATSSYVIAKNTDDFLRYHKFIMSRTIDAKGITAILNRLHLGTKTFRAKRHQAWVFNEIKSGLALLKQYHSGTPLILIYSSNNPSKKVVFRGETDLRAIIQAIQEASYV